jgi:hypothetical protein
MIKETKQLLLYFLGFPIVVGKAVKFFLGLTLCAILNIHRMKKYIFICLLFFPIFIFSQKNSMELTVFQKEKIKNLVNTWLTTLIEAKSIDSLMEISTIPFVFDSKKIVTNSDDLKEKYKKVFIHRLERPEIPKYEIKSIEYKSEVIENCIPISFAKVLLLIGEGEKQEDMIVSVLITDNDVKIAGFND